MNERVMELAEQAGMTNDKFGMYFAKDKHDEDGVDLEKFTELLVRECANYITHKATIETLLGERLMEHFGVEE
jgi:regulator of RNase E activity RraB